MKFAPKSSYTPVVDITVNDSTTIKRITFDTGYGGYLTLNGNNFDSSLTVLEKSYGYSSSGLYGSVFDTVLEVKTNMTLDGFNQKGPVNYSMSKSKNLLGMDFLNQFEIVLDWNTNTVELYPTKVKNQKIKSFGFSPKWHEGKLIVGSVARGSVAEIEGLNVGDVIVKLNRFDFREPRLDMYCSMMLELHGKRVEVISLELEDGRSYTFTKDVLTK
jgi:predicted aspartyl protease